MSRNNQDGFGIAAAIFLGALGVLWAVVLALGSFIFNQTRSLPEDELRALGLDAFWGNIIATTRCPRCQTANESIARVCISCGSTLQQAQAQRNQRKPITLNKWQAMLLAFFLVFACLFILGAFVN